MNNSLDVTWGNWAVTVQYMDGSYIAAQHKEKDGGGQLCPRYTETVHQFKKEGRSDRLFVIIKIKDH